MSRLRILLCGVGNMGANHLRTLKEASEDCEVVGVVDSSPLSAERVGDTPLFNDVAEALDATGPEAAVVATPTETHYDIAGQIIRAGFPVLVEKPIAATAAQGERLLTLAQEHGVTLMVGHVERFNPAVVAVQRLVSEGQLGEIINVSARRVGGTPQDVHKAGHVLIDLAVHDIDITASLLGEPTLHAVHAHRGTYVDSATMLFSCGGVSVDIHCNWVTPVKIRSLTVTGSEGHLSANLIAQQVTLTKRNPILTNQRQGDEGFLGKKGGDKEQAGGREQPGGLAARAGRHRAGFDAGVAKHQRCGTEGEDRAEQVRARPGRPWARPPAGGRKRPALRSATVAGSVPGAGRVGRPGRPRTRPAAGSGRAGARPRPRSARCSGGSSDAAAGGSCRGRGERRCGRASSNRCTRARSR